MITRRDVSNKLMAYLNGAVPLADLVAWAEDAIVETDFGPDEDIPLLADVMMALAAADTAASPLTWEVCVDLMRQLGSPVKVVPA